MQELSIYGAGRLGVLSPTVRQDRGPFYATVSASNISVLGATRTLDQKRYEITDHLGNVRVVITDRKEPQGTGFTPTIVSVANFYPFGMEQPGRTWQAGDYRYGYNGMERDDNLKGQGNSYATPFRMNDPRLAGRWWSTDPITKPWESPYAGYGNNPVSFTDPSGLTPEEGVDPNWRNKVKEGLGIDLDRASSQTSQTGQPALYTGLPNTYTPLVGLQDAEQARQTLERAQQTSAKISIPPVAPVVAEKTAEKVAPVIAEKTAEKVAPWLFRGMGRVLPILFLLSLEGDNTPTSNLRRSPNPTPVPVPDPVEKPKPVYGNPPSKDDDEYITVYKALRPAVDFNRTLAVGVEIKDYPFNPPRADGSAYFTSDPSVASNYSFNYQNGIVAFTLPKAVLNSISIQDLGEKRSYRIPNSNFSIFNTSSIRSPYEKPLGE